MCCENKLCMETCKHFADGKCTKGKDKLYRCAQIFVGDDEKPIYSKFYYEGDKDSNDPIKELVRIRDIYGSAENVQLIVYEVSDVITFAPKGMN